MKKLLVLLALCMVLAVMFVACEQPETPVDETTAGTTEAPTTQAPETEAPTTQAPETEAPTTQAPETEPPTTETNPPETTEPPVVIDPVKVGMSFDECDPWTGDAQGTAFFTPGQSASWDGKAVIEDYNVSAIRVWGWVAFFAETPGTFGYQIGDADPVFDAVFSVEAEQPVIDAALSQGGKSAARMKIMIPVEYLSGEEIVIKALVKDAVGTVETLVEFKLTKPVNPNAPVAFIPAADMASSIPGSPGITSATLSGNGTFVTIDAIGQGDPYYQLPMLNQKGTVAQFAAIKYRSSSSFTTSEMFVGSGAGPNGQGDNIRFELTCDDNWNLVIIDLSQATAVADGVVNYLRWDPFAGSSDATIDLGYVALFNTAEAALAYDAQFANVYRNVPYHNDVAVDLGVRTSGGPFSGVKTFGQKLPLGETFLKQITIKNMATYADGNTNTWALKIWAWNTDYATTVAGTPLYVVNGENHQDNQDFIVDIPVKLLISGDVYYELEYLTGSAQFTGWAADVILVEGVQTYVAGELAEGTYASAVVVGVEAEPPVEKPENGSLELPLTVGETLTAVEGLESGASTEVQYYTTGVVTEIGQGGSYYKNVYFTDGENTMLIYTLNPMEGMGELKVGDTITVYGYIKNYNGTIEFASKYVDDVQVYVYVVAHEAAPVEEAPVYEGNWHASVDSFMYCVNDDFSDVVDFTAAATNNHNKTTITNATGTLTSVNAKYVYFANGWLAVDGYALENYVCNIYAADGSLLKTIALNLREAESGVVQHVANNMLYGEGTVSHRVGQNDAEIISLAEFAGQTVTVSYEIDAANSDYTITLIELEVIVP